MAKPRAHGCPPGEYKGVFMVTIFEGAHISAPTMSKVSLAVGRRIRSRALCCCASSEPFQSKVVREGFVSDHQTTRRFASSSLRGP